MKLKDILKEEKEFSLYQALVRVGHTEEITASQVADFVRAMPGVTRVTAVDSNEDINIVILKVKILTAKQALQVFEKLKKDTFRLVPNIKKVDLSVKSIEKVTR
jgi:PII-like signaling protein